jgi:hypothetical protein
MREVVKRALELSATAIIPVHKRLLPTQARVSSAIPHYVSKRGLPAEAVEQAAAGQAQAAVASKGTRFSRAGISAAGTALPNR